MLTSCKVAFYKLNIYDANFESLSVWNHISESTFKGINLRKLCVEAFWIKCILNATETIIKTFDKSNSSSYRNSLAILHNNCLMYIMTTLSPSGIESSRVNCSSFLLVRDHSHITSAYKYINFTHLTLVRKNYKRNQKPESVSLPPDDVMCELLLCFPDKVYRNFLLVTFSFGGIPYHRQIQLPLIKIMFYNNYYFLSKILFRMKSDIEHIRKWCKSTWCKKQTFSFCSDVRTITINRQSSIKRPEKKAV